MNRSMQEVESLYDEFVGIDSRNPDSLGTLQELYARVKELLGRLAIKEKYHKIYESTSGPSYNLRFFLDEDISVAASVRRREVSFYDEEHRHRFDEDQLLLSIAALDLRLRVDYAIDDLQEQIAGHER